MYIYTYKQYFITIYKNEHTLVRTKDFSERSDFKILFLKYHLGFLGLVKIGSTPCQKVLADLPTKTKYCEERNSEKTMFNCVNKIIIHTYNTGTTRKYSNLCMPHKY